MGRQGNTSRLAAKRKAAEDGAGAAAPHGQGLGAGRAAGLREGPAEGGRQALSTRGRGLFRMPNRQAGSSDGGRQKARMAAGRGKGRRGRDLIPAVRQPAGAARARRDERSPGE